MITVALGDLIAPANVERAGDREFPILSMTMHHGLVDQSLKFKKRVASEDLSQYRVVNRDQLVVGFPIDEGVLSFQQLYERAVVSPAYAVWDLRESGHTIEPRYLERFLRSPRALSFYLAKLRGTTARRRSLPREIFLSLQVPLPSLEDQRRLADALDAADALRKKRVESIEKVESLKLSIFLDKFGDPTSNAKGWPVVPLQEVCFSKGQYGAALPATTYESGLPRYIRITDVTANGDLLSECVSPKGNPGDWEKFRLQDGDVLFARSGATVGKTYMHSGEMDAVFAGYFIRFQPDPSKLLPEVLFHFTKTNAYSGWVNRKKKTFGQPNINAKQYGTELPVLVPPLDHQKEFVQSLAQIGVVRSQQRRSRDELETFFRAAQDQAFTTDHE